MSPELLSKAALIGSACVLGAMLFFSTTVAPLIFIHLPAETAGSFIRSLFPHYYLNLAAVSLLTLTAALISGVWEGMYLAALAAVAAGFIVARQWIMPRINHWREAAGRDDPVAPRKFKRWHAASVLLNAAQMLALAFICFGVAPWVSPPSSFAAAAAKAPCRMPGVASLRVFLRTEVSREAQVYEPLSGNWRMNRSWQSSKSGASRHERSAK